ncbi:1,2-phenylacetyl-CoA epoxidase subunit PaaC [uncultured Piscinibacter sp.]|uniref:1,2-phenylacetyl-CoA epoxidase subunit PaaC n=1 Tax=uncultured Piscinibacter sp. TaxID=1131835 RepID=UPI00262EF63A|nr:1,2-phenylacetyl-CoA epoxidase subunit PaaC [uncultured Piscinibacter sp.]
MDARLDYILRIADACLIHGQRLGQWCGHAPVLEEDIALTNVALDHIGQARALLTLAGELEGRGRDEDALAFLRQERDYRNVTMLELPNGDFARTVLRAFLWASFMKVLCQALATSTNAQLAAIAAKTLKEVRYHQQHTGDWVVRLGDGTEESARRIGEALTLLWPYTAEWFADDDTDIEARSSGLGPAWSTLKDAWMSELRPVLGEAGLAPLADTPFRSTGKLGRHSEHMGFLLAEMQSLPRAFPGAVW